MASGDQRGIFATHGYMQPPHDVETHTPSTEMPTHGFRSHASLLLDGLWEEALWQILAVRITTQLCFEQAGCQQAVMFGTYRG